MGNPFTPPGGDRTFDASITGLFGLVLVVMATPWWPRPLDYPRPAVAAVGALVLGGGVLLWRRRGWARWPVTGIVAGLAGLALGRMLADGFSVWRLLGPAALLWHCWEVLRHFSPQALADSLPNTRPEGPMVSLVLLLRRSRHLEATLLARYAESVWSVPFQALGRTAGSADTGPGAWVGGQSPLFMVAAPEGFFIVHNHASPYFSDPARLSSAVDELRLRKVVEENRGWLAVDLIRLGDEMAEPESAYPAIARFIAELAGPDCQALFQPATNRFHPWDDELEARLRTGDVTGVFAVPTKVPVVHVPEDDPRLLAAVAEARGRWPEFVVAFESRSGDSFSVKAPISGAGNTEFIWVQVDSLAGGDIAGRLANEPVDLGDLKEGSPVTVRVADLNDWAFVRNGEPEGMFTVKAIAAIRGEGGRGREMPAE